MKPFTAWLATDEGLPVVFGGWALYPGALMAKSRSVGESCPLRILIVADTPENRKKLGMEEG